MHRSHLSIITNRPSPASSNLPCSSSSNSWSIDWERHSMRAVSEGPSHLALCPVRLSWFGAAKAWAGIGLSCRSRGSPGGARAPRWVAASSTCDLASNSTIYYTVRFQISYLFSRYSLNSSTVESPHCSKCGWWLQRSCTPWSASAPPSSSEE